MVFGLERESKCLKKGQSAFRRSGDKKMCKCGRTRLVQMISTINDATIVDRDGKTGEKTWK